MRCEVLVPELNHVPFDGGDSRLKLTPNPSLCPYALMQICKFLFPPFDGWIRDMVHFPACFKFLKKCVDTLKWNVKRDLGWGLSLSKPRNQRELFPSRFTFNPVSTIFWNMPKKQEIFELVSTLKIYLRLQGLHIQPWDMPSREIDGSQGFWLTVDDILPGRP